MVISAYSRIYQSTQSINYAAAFPFTAIVGQDEMKLCLLLNVIDPRISGVMVMGHRGTGKSTTVRALADVLPDIKRMTGDVYNRSEEISDFRGQILVRGCQSRIKYQN